MFVGTNSAVAPCAAIARAGSENVESRQIAIPNVRSPTAKTGVVSPAAYTDLLIAGWSLRYTPATEPRWKTAAELCSRPSMPDSVNPTIVVTVALASGASTSSNPPLSTPSAFAFGSDE